MDVIEIDAASNRGINEMRELRENVRFRPARDRYKVFIVDEAHQITSEAFNALLKTLEEPPEWVVFMLCTTETHKIPSTIASRCQQFSFRSVDFAELVARMEWIIQQEGIEADPEVLSVLAQAGEGSVRDSLSALDQAIACCGNKLEADAGARTAGHVLAGIAGTGGARRWPQAMRKGCWTWWPSSKRTAAACSTSRASWLATSAIFWWCGSKGGRRGWWRRRRRSRNAWLEAAGAVQRRRSDAGSETVARSVPGFAKLAAAAAASGDGLAAADSCGTVAADRRSAGGVGRIAAKTRDSQPSSAPKRSAETRANRHRQPRRSRQSPDASGDFRTRLTGDAARSES